MDPYVIVMVHNGRVLMSLVGFGPYSMEVGSKMYQQYDLQYLKSYTKIVIPTFTQ